MAGSNYDNLVTKLDQFIRKFYINKIIKGSLITISVVALYFVAIALLEHQFYFGKTGRKILFFSFLALSLGSLLTLVVYPLTKWLKLGKTISHQQAAGIIGDHFVDVKDKLLNVLQLKNSGNTDSALINASIEQKTNEIKIVPFSKAIDLSKNKKYLRYALPPLLLLLCFLIAAPSVLRSSADRLLHNNKEYEKAAPFHFVLAQEDLNVIQYEDFELNVSTTGSVIPQEAFIQIDDFTYRMTKAGPNQFSYTFNNVQKDVDFSFNSGFVSSLNHQLHVLHKPVIAGFGAYLDYPAYTELKDERLINDGDFVIPVGTKVNWTFDTEYTDQISIRLGENAELIQLDQKSDKSYSISKRIHKDTKYSLFLSNDEIGTPDSLAYIINTIPDNYPEISAKEFRDSLNPSLVFFAGQVRDDYGLRSLGFHYQKISPQGKNSELISNPLKLESKLSSTFSHSFNIAQIDLLPGEEVNYYFEVYDNDGVSGSKSSRTEIYTFRLPSQEEIENLTEENDKQIKSSLNDNKKDSKKLKEDIKKLKEELLQEKELDWKKKKEIEKLVENQKELQKKFQEAQEKFQENKKNQEKFDDLSDEMKEKQEKVEDLFDEAKNEELQELMEKVQELMDEMEKEDALEFLEEFQESAEEMEFEMERALEMYKQLEVELEMEKQIKELEKLAEEQKALAEETKKKESGENTDEQKEKQEEISEKFEDIKEKIEEIEKKNEELKSPKEIPEEKEKEESIQQKQQESMQDMEQKENKKAGQKQQEAGEEMEEMANEMQQAMQQGEDDQMAEDMEMLRQLLENLITLSFEQETLLNSFRRTRVNTPRYTYLTQSQKNIKDDFKLVEDTLRELSIRVYELESFITEKVTDINANMNKSLVELEERQKTQASEHQQRTMTSLNDLALMLNESLEQMQQQMAQGKPNAQCKKPGNNPGGQGNVPMDKITKGQEDLKGKMQEQMGKQKGGKQGSAKEFAEMAAQQAALRKALEAKRKSQAEKGKGTKSLQELVDQMDKIETDLVNKKLTNEMLLRQSDILTRLLEEERAEREREFDNKRKSEQGADIEKQMPPALEQYLKEREAEIDVYRTISPELRSYYKSLVEKYYQELKN